MVYRSGAELVHTATARLEQGNNQLIIGDVSNAIDESSIRISCSSNVTILSVAVSTDYLRQEPAGPFVKKLLDSIVSIEKELTRLTVMTRTDNELLELLGSNKSIGGSTTGVSVAELSKMMDYYRTKTIELRSELSGYADKEQQWKAVRDKLRLQIQEQEKKNGKTGGALVLQLMSPAAGPCDLTISYLTTAAHWEPSYDLKTGNSNDSLHILYKARLVQTSGIDWKQVKLSLSTALPAQGGNAPVLTTWFLRFVDPNAGIYSNVSGYSNRLAEVAVKDLEYKSMSADSTRSQLADYVSVNEQQMDAVFDIDIPYDVAGNGKEQGVVLKEYRLPCAYQYYAAPRVDRDAYLLGQVVGWEKLNLLPGEASIMVEGTYIGKSYLDPGSLQDTLNLTLGRDKRIVVKKEKVTDFSSVNFLGSNKKQVFTYEITVRNNKKEKVNLLLKDQYPISSNKDIEDELLDGGGAAINRETGILTWKVELAPGESRKYRISYSVKYPKDKYVNITGA
jgi:uncharacterized protein (TIGR02231 family)